MTIYKEGSSNRTINKLIQKAVGAYPDGVWGPLTTECLKAWQRAHSLTPDGIAGPLTLAKMGIDAGKAGLQVQGSDSRFQVGSGLTLKKSKRRIDYIAVHCTGSREGQDMTVEEIRRSHRAQGWSDIGYHYVIDRSGKIHNGRDVDIAGSHVKGYNANSIGVVYVGGLENKPNTPYVQLKAKDTRTEQQKASLLSLLKALRKLYPNAVIQGHRDFSPDKNHDGVITADEWIKDCPCFDAKKEYAGI